MNAPFYPASLNLAGRRCVVIGDDREAHEKSADLEEAGGVVTRIADAAAVTEDDVRDAFFVISTPQDEQLSAWLRELAETHRFLLCAIDQPAYGFVAMQAIVKAGPARIGISTGGIAPRAGGILRAALQDALDARFARFLARLAERREQSKAAHPGDSAARRAVMLATAEGFEVKVSINYPQWFLDEDAR